MIPHAKSEKQKDDYDYDYEREAKVVKWHHRILLSRPLKVVLLALIVAVTAPMLIYHYMYYDSVDRPPSDGYSTGSCLLPRSARLMCGQGIVTAEQCHPQCCYDLESGICFHRYPSRFTYILEDEEWTENTALRPRHSTSPFINNNTDIIRNNIGEIKLSIDEVSPTHVSVTFYNPSLSTFAGRRIEEKNYTYKVSSPELNIVVNDTIGNIMFDTIKGPIIASENIWEVSFKMTNEDMYGLGEIPLEEGMVKVIHNNPGGENGVPLIFGRTNGSYHGVLLETSGPTEVAIKGMNQVVVRSITNASLTFHLLSGPQPKDIMADVMNITGYKTSTLKYWMLGAHICSDVPSNDILALEDFLTAAAKDKVPFDSHCGTSPVVFNDDLCEGRVQNRMASESVLVKYNGKKYIPHISPYISIYEEPEEATNETSTEIIDIKSEVESTCLNITTKYEYLILRAPDSTSDSVEFYKGSARNATVIYPDYKEKTADDIVRKMLNVEEIDGAVLENNWPLDESVKLVNETVKYLPYFSKNFEEAFNHTPQWNITRPDGEMYMYKHNEYGNDFAKAFNKAYYKYVPIWTSSQSMSGDIVNKQNVNTTWINLQKELIEASLGGISGHWLWSSPVCGDTDHYNNIAHENLCVKWYMAATYLPLIKIHSKSTPRDPLSFIGTNKNRIITALNQRQSLLPYFYTTLQQGPLLRPMFYQFHDSKNLSNIKTQFSVGDDLLIVPNLLPSQTHVHVTMPPGVWYEIWSGLHIDAEAGEVVTMTTTDADLLTLIRGGSILVTQRDTNETAEKTRRHSQYSITIALECINVTTTINNIDQIITECNAGGTLYINENMTLVFKANDEELTIKSEGADFDTFCNFQKAIAVDNAKEIFVYGLKDELNNYDNHRYIANVINLCDLKDKEEIIVKLI